MTDERVDVHRGRDRRHLHPGRPRRLAPRFTDTEAAELAAAAAAVGMTPTGFLAEAGLATARGIPSPELDPVRENLARLQRELFGLRTAAGRAQPFVPVGEAARFDRMLREVDEVIDRVDRQLARINRERPRLDGNWHAFTASLVAHRGAS
ncbi:hypothetical protein ACTOB_003817 [Actinoplanes oblitus]|uniref:Uncharacterized protein n=1 Tax=Actinoplanes oblitus TaxID=3040509 RepID=A0ABY8WQH5_9ACTN|nr:hypothetical protein [Actinoplanes oblitus]WIN00132.1 hypothetical protein ACTOB_003817 [Actinoplanes oblitus]